MTAGVAIYIFTKTLKIWKKKGISSPVCTKFPLATSLPTAKSDLINPCVDSFTEFSLVLLRYDVMSR